MSDSEDYHTCPFFPQHKLITGSRYPLHIMKCMKNYRGVKLTQCSYNAMHYYEHSKMAEHLKNCKDYQIVECQRYADASNFN